MTSTRNTNRINRSGGRLVPEGGFTLVEMLVAIGAVALLAVGIAQVFSATGKTVAAGRRLSYLNAQAGLLERQLRDDFSSMTRDGFLVIRNQYANNPTFQPGSNPSASNLTPVQLNPDDLAPRARRIDEIAFFARGNFRTLRDARHPDRIAKADAARIYYGHGQRRDPLNREPGANNGTSGYDMPILLNDDNHLAGHLGESSQGNANRYAQDWVLTRHLTLLSPLANTSDTVRDLDSPQQPHTFETPEERDNIFQIAWQPAAAGIFRIVNGDDTRTASGFRAPNSPTDATTGNVNNWLYRNSTRNDGVRPLFASGAVDIAATDLTTIRQMIMDNPAASNNSTAMFITPTIDSAQRAAEDQAEWMIGALPAASDGGRRIRVEPNPPNMLGLGTGWAQIRTDAAALAAARVDQHMLASGAFLQRCTEFIVEWSFGEIDTDPAHASDPYQSGRMVWHGLDRAVDLDGDGTEEYIVRPYGAAGTSLVAQSWVRRDGTSNGIAIEPELIHPLMANIDTGTSGQQQLGLYSCFAYINPYFTPQLTGTYPVYNAQGQQTGTRPAVDYGRLRQPDRTNTAMPNPGAVYDPSYGDVLMDPGSIPWPWPALIRVTVTLADPNDPKLERTFQFIFKTPGQTVGGSAE
ncbi:MAG: hypothetical protein ACREJO_06745 [Phycisphaerales bacterium]